MKKYLLALFALLIALLMVLSPSPALAGPPSPIPTAWGGGSAVVDLPDFTYPADNGCYRPVGSLTLVGNNPLDWDYFVADLTVTDSIGRVTDSFYKVEDGYNTTIPLDEQLCTLFDTPGAYSVTGTIEFNDYPYYWTVPVSDTFTITGYTPPPAPAPAPAPAPHVNRRCVQAKAALKKAKKQNKPYRVIQQAQKKVKRVC